MPTFSFTSPQGKSYDITGPEGATKEQAFQILQSQLAQSSAPKMAPTVQPAESPGMIEKLAGAGEAALTMGTGALAAPVSAVMGAYKGLTGGKLGTQAGVREGEQRAKDVAENLTYSPRTESGKQQVSAVGDFLKSAGIEALGGLAGETGALANATKMAKPGIVGAAGKAVQAVKDSPEAFMLGKGLDAAGSAAKGAIPKLMGFDPEAVKLAQKAQDLGINIRPDMLSNNKVVKMMGEALEKIPLSGAKGEARQEAFNKALIKQIGGDPKATRLNSDVFSEAMTKSGKEIGRIGEQNGIVLDKNVSDALTNFVKEADRYETKDVKSIVKNYVNEIKSKTKDDTLDGTAFKKINSKIGRQIRATSNGDLKNSLSDLQEIMHDALEKSISKDDLDALKEARTYYAKGKVLEPLVAKATTGDISGPSLMSRVTADKAGKARMAKGGGDMGDLARIGQLMKEPGSSGTTERALAYSLLGGGAYVNPGTAAALYGTANLYNRFGQYLIPPPPK